MSVVPLHYIDAGRGPAAVLVHAIGCDMGMWDELAADLAAGGLRVVRVDVRGHGASPVPKRPYSLMELAQDVALVLDRCGIEKAHWVGLSMGGMIGQAFAIAHPGRLARLVLANTTSSYGADGPKMWEARAKAVEDGGMAAITELAMTRYFSDAFRLERADVVERIRSRFLATDSAGLYRLLRRDPRSSTSPAGSRGSAPTLVIAGEKDAGTPPAMSEAIAKAVPGAELAVIPGAAHLSAVEKPREFNALVRGFLCET